MMLAKSYGKPLTPSKTLTYGDRCLSTGSTTTKDTTTEETTAGREGNIMNWKPRAQLLEPWQVKSQQLNTRA